MLTNDEIVHRGSLAARILTDEDLISFFEELKTDIKDSLFNTQPSESVERERLYYQLRGVEDVLTTMLAYQAKAEEILALYNELNNQ